MLNIIYPEINHPKTQVPPTTEWWHHNRVTGGMATTLTVQSELQIGKTNTHKNVVVSNDSDTKRVLFRACVPASGQIPAPECQARPRCCPRAAAVPTPCARPAATTHTATDHSQTDKQTQADRGMERT